MRSCIFDLPALLATTLVWRGPWAGRQVVWLALAAALAWGLAGTAIAQEAEPAPDPVIPGDDIVLPPAPEALVTDSRHPEVRAAVRRFQQGDFDGALELLREAADVHPELSPPRLMLAELFFSTRQAQQVALGRGLLEEVVREHPNDPEAYMIIAEIALRENRFAEAGLSLEKAKALLSTFEGDARRKENLQIRLHNYLAAAAERRGNWEEARNQLDAWLELDPESAQAHHRRGIALFQLGQHDAAFEELKLGKEGIEQLPPPMVTMGRLYEQADDREKAREWMNRALEADPDGLETLLGVAQWMLQTEQFEAARPIAEKAVELDPESVQAKLLSGVVARFLRDNGAAERYFEAAHLQSPSNFAASNNLALTLAEQDSDAKRRRALELATLNARTYNDPQSVATLAWVYYNLDRYDEAARLLRALSNSRQVSADGMFYMAKVAAKLNKVDEARQLLALALDAEVPFVHRKEAEEWLEEIGGRPADDPGSDR